MSQALNGLSTPEAPDTPEIPPELVEKKIHVINELTRNPQPLKGLYEFTQSAEDIYKIQRKQALENIDKAKAILHTLESITELRSSTTEKLNNAKSLEKEWINQENEMYRSLQPFSLPALQTRLDIATNEAESVSDTLVNSFLEDSNNSNVGDFVKNYRKERKSFHLRKERLERWKEERVART